MLTIRSFSLDLNLELPTNPTGVASSTAEQVVVACILQGSLGDYTVSLHAG